LAYYNVKTVIRPVRFRFITCNVYKTDPYFIGDINIPNSNRKQWRRCLTSISKEYEPEFLRRLLGSAGYNTRTSVIMLPENVKMVQPCYVVAIDLPGAQFNTITLDLVPVGEISSTYVTNQAEAYLLHGGWGGRAGECSKFVYV